MQIAIDLTVEDMAALRRFCQKRSGYGQFIFWGAYGIVPLVLVLIGLSNDTFSSANTTIFTVALIIVWLLAYGRIYQWLSDDEVRRMYAAGRNRAVIGPQTIELSETNVVMENSVSTTRISWAGIESVQESDKYIYLFVSAMGAFVIPKRSFRDNAAADQFLVEANMHFSQTNGQKGS